MSPTTTAEAADLTAITAAVNAQAAARAQLTAQAAAMASSSAASFDGWYNSAAITAWAATLASQIEVLQSLQAQSTDAYLSTVLGHMLGRHVRPVGRVNVTNLRAGITHAGSYARAADAYRYQQHKLDQFATVLTSTPEDELQTLAPTGLVKPVAAAVQRVTAVADADIQLADSHQTRKVLSAHSQITGWRRVVHPELSRTGTCGLCIAASDRVYHVKDLRPIHEHCACTTLPIVGSNDPGSSLNNLDLQGLYKQAGSTGAADLKRTRYSINEHGELGPVLTDGTFRTPSTVRLDRQRRPVRTPEQQQAALQRLLATQEAAQGRAEQLANTDPAKWGDYASQLSERIDSLRSQIN